MIYNLRYRNYIPVISLIILLSLFGSSTADAQGSWNFAAPTDGSGTAGAETGKGICTDASGNVYITGPYGNNGTGNTDFNLSNAATNTAPTNGVACGFVASYDKNGNYRWHTIIAGTSTSFSAPSGAICTNGTYVWFAGTTNMAGSPQVISPSNTISIVSTGGTGTDNLVGQLNCSNGAVNWAVEFGGASGNDLAQGICVDPAGCVYVIGSYGGTFTLNSITAPASGGTSDLYVAKFNTTGALIHLTTGGSTTGADMIANGGSLCYVPGASPSIVAVGSFAAGTASYAGGVYTFVNSGASGHDALLLELDTTLNITNAIGVGAGTAATDELLGVVYDPFSGGVYVSGSFNGGAITLPGTAALTSAGVQDVLIACYSVTGNNFIWSRRAGGTGDDRGQAIAVDGVGGILMSGYTGSASSVFGSFTVGTTGLNDLFVARYNTGGTPQWVLTAGGVTDDQARGIASYVETTPSYVQNVYVTGNFQSTAAFGSTSMTADGGNDIFLARIIDLTISLPLKLLSFTGRRVDDFTNRLQWQTAEEVNTKQFIVERSTNGSSYSPIGLVGARSNGPNDYSYEDRQATASCWYRLKMEDIDGKFTYSKVLYLSRSAALQSSVFPNPVSTWFQLHSPVQLLTTTATISNAGGATLKTFLIKDMDMIIDIQDIPAGVYFLTFENGQVLKILKDR